MSAISRDLIHIFPNSKDTVAISKLFYEQNITNIVRQVTDKECYVICGRVNTDGTGKVDGKLTLSLYGYYLCIKNETDLVGLAKADSADAVYINIFLNNNSPQELDGQTDSSGDDRVFDPITLTTEKAISGANNTVYSLKILEKVSGKWQIPNDSKIKFNAESFGLYEIDGQHTIRETK